MFVSIARQVIKTEDLEKYHEMAKVMVERSKKEDGCIGYQSIQQQDDPRVHLFVETWRDEDAMQKHIASEHFQTYVPQFPAMFEEEEVVTRYNILY